MSKLIKKHYKSLKMKTQTMKLLWSIILVVGISACQNKPLPEFLQEADAIVNSAPDSAWTLLERQQDKIRFEPECARMYYNLLTIKAKDKAYINHTSDSLILQVVHYYENNDDSQYLPEVYFYAGRVYRDLGDAPQALDYFQKAAEVSKGSNNHELVCRIHNQMGMLYLYQHIYDNALVAFKCALQPVKQSKDSVNLALHNLRDIGRAYFGLQNVDSALFYYKQAKQTAQKVDNKQLVGSLSQEIAGIYIELGKYAEAHNIIKSSLHISKKDMPVHYVVLANLYDHTSKKDSAKYYYTKLLSMGNYYHKRAGYKGLSSIARQEGKLAEALVYIDKYLLYTDSISKRIDTEAVRKVNSLYNYQLKEIRNQHLEAIAQKQKTWIITLLASIGIVSILFTASIIIYNQQKKQKRLQSEQQQDKLRNITEGQYRNSRQYVIENEKRIAILNSRLEDTENEKNVTEKVLQETEKELLELTNKQIETKQKIHTLTEKAFKESQIYKDFYHVAKMPNSEKISEKKKLSTEDWEELVKALDKTYNNFTWRLQMLYPSISEQELHICILLKLSITPMAIANLTLRTKQAVSTARKKLYEKTHNQPGTPSMWDDFIRDF